MKIHFTLRRRLLALSLSGLFFVVVLSAVGLSAAKSLSSARDAITASMTAVKAHMDADMIHDALSGDVLAALLAGTRQDAAAQKEIAHAPRSVGGRNPPPR